MEYMTSEDRVRIEADLKAMIAKRSELSQRIGTAREMGDLKENAEYHAAREDQGLNEMRIKELETKLARAVIADTESIPDDMVFIGAVVRLRDIKSGIEDLYKLVGETTGSFDLDYVEVTPNSALGLALMKSHVGETVRVDLPKGEKKFEIVEIVT